MPPGAVALLILLAALLLLVAGYRLARAGVSRRARARARGGLRGEAAAARLLARAGYEVEGRGVARSASITVDGERLVYEVRADMLARCRHGLLHVVEVKTGARAPDPLLGATRRQLLEYAMVFGTAHVLLVDMEAGEIHEIGFETLRA